MSIYRTLVWLVWTSSLLVNNTKFSYDYLMCLSEPLLSRVRHIIIWHYPIVLRDSCLYICDTVGREGEVTAQPSQTIGSGDCAVVPWWTC